MTTLTPYFGGATLARVGVARVSCIAAPFAGWFERFVPPGMLDLTTVRGMAFIDTVVIATANCRADDDEVSLLFHELVHIVQYDLLGTRGFVAAYVRGWLDAGRSYIDNPMEGMAFELQERFDEGDVHDVAVEVEHRLARL